MAVPGKIVLHSVSASRSALPDLVAAWISQGVGYVGIIGEDAAELEDEIDSLCIGEGSEPYFMLTAAHGTNETLEDAVALAEQVSTVAGTVAVVEL
jgi:hypothetical protein